MPAEDQFGRRQVSADGSKFLQRIPVSSPSSIRDIESAVGGNGGVSTPGASRVDSCTFGVNVYVKVVETSSS